MKQRQFESVMDIRYDAQIEERGTHLAVLVVGVFRRGSSGVSGPIESFEVIARRDAHDESRWHGIEEHQGSVFTYHISHQGL